ncbi:MAG: methyltransferase [Gammaproteobacteria bacterium]|jgi:23S rRNA (cytosine1962-C5)-methyltransferase|nr:MAG: methyltransferase [Gammaproteobacteria bacterium]
MSDPSTNEAEQLEAVLESCRSRWGTGPDTARRLFHGRGHCYPGLEDLVVDRFGSVLLVGCFGDNVARARRLAGLLDEALEGVAGVAVQQRQGRGTRAEVVRGAVEEELIVQEAGLRYLVQPLRNQNVGLFLDMAPTRRWLVDAAEGKRVLNLFSFTCAFSVAALAGGATQVVNNDMSKPALDWGRKNHELNGHDPRQVSMLPHNLFKSWWKIREYGPYDIIIIDPPTNQRGSFNAEKQYGQILKRLPEFAATGSTIIACLNSPFLNTDFLPGQMARWCPRASLIETLPAAEDFPERYPDRGLKIYRFEFS